MTLTPQQRRQLARMAVGASGNRVADAMRLAGFTQADVAARTDLSQPYVSDVARGRYATITLDKARQFAQLFGCSIDELFPARQQEVA